MPDPAKTAPRAQHRTSCNASCQPALNPASPAPAPAPHPAAIKWRSSNALGDRRARRRSAAPPPLQTAARDAAARSAAGLPPALPPRPRVAARPLSDPRSSAASPPASPPSAACSPSPATAVRSRTAAPANRCGSGPSERTCHLSTVTTAIAVVTVPMGIADSSADGTCPRTASDGLMRCRSVPPIGCRRLRISSVVTADSLLPLLV